MASEQQAFWENVHQTRQYSRVISPHVDRALHAAHIFFGDLTGKTLVDLGCGGGASSFYFADRGAQVFAVDISQSAIEHLRSDCATKGIRSITPIRRSALDLDELPCVDFVFGSMILHHIEPFSQFAETLFRALNANGRGFFFENNAASRMLIWFRDNLVGKLWIPKLGDPDEFPLTPQEVDALRRYFDVEVQYPELYLFRLASMYLLKKRLYKFTETLDAFCYKRRILREYSYRQYILVKKPAKALCRGHQDFSPTSLPNT